MQSARINYWLLAILLSAVVAGLVFAGNAYASPSSSGFVWPFKTAIPHGQGYSWNASTKTGHGGIDIPASEGTEVIASMAGTVKYVQKFNARTDDSSSMESYGNLVILYHPSNQMTTYYAHMKDISVSVGDSVSQGQVVGHVGLTGTTTGYHLHFETRTGGTAAHSLNGQGTRQNPLNYVSKNDLYDGGPTPSPMTIADGTYIVHASKDPTKVLDVYGSSVKDSANIYIYSATCNDNQQFRFTRNSDDGTYRITNVRSGKCLDVEGGSTADHANVQQYAPNNTGAQRWYIIDAGNGMIKLLNKGSGKYLDVEGNGTANETNVQIYSSTDSAAQKFALSSYAEFGSKCTTLASGYYVLRSAINKSYAVQAEGGKTASGTNLQIWQLPQGNSQVFHIVKQGDGFYSLHPKGSDSVSFDVEGGGFGNSVNVRLYTSNNTLAQRWILRSLGDGKYAFQNVLSGKYLDVRSGVVSQGENVQQYLGNSSNAQIFFLDSPDVATPLTKVAKPTANSFTYDGVSHTGITKGTGFTLTGSTSATSAGSYQVTVKLNSGYAWNDGSRDNLTLNWKISPAKITSATLSQTTYAYNGTVQKPEINAVRANSLNLGESDYDVAYSDEGSKDAGSYTVTVTGKGNFTGSATAEYSIEPAAVTSVELSASTFAYNGEVQKPSVSAVKAGELKLGESDYDVAYSDEGSKDAGSYTVTVTGKGNFTGSATAEYSITDEGGQGGDEPSDVDKAAAETVVTKINAIGDVTLASKEAIEEARSSYDSLTPAQKALVPATALETLQAAEAAFGQAQQEADDKAAAESAIAKINAIGNVSLASKEAIEEARSSYDSLTPAQKALVPATALEILLKAESSYKQAAEDQSKENEKDESGSAAAAAAKVGGKPAVQVERSITTAASDEGPSGTKFSKLKARSTKQTKSSITLAWNKVAGANGYTVYGNKCGKGNKYVKIADVRSTKYVVKKAAGKKIAKGKYYKFLVVSWRMVDGYKVATSVSKTLHVATLGGKVGNYKKVKLSKKGFVLTKGKSLRLKATPIAASKKLKVKQHRKVKFESSNTKVAVVSSKGVVKAKAKGTCYVYAYAQSGSYARCKVTVR